jgi:NhaP-type Na+/H+ or K+/H+ antiporter
MNTYALAAVATGVLILIAAWVPAFVDARPLSLPIVLVGIGALAWTVLPQLPDVDPRSELGLTEHATELAVLISLLGAGLALDRRPGWKSWATTWRLLGIAMPLTIAALFIGGWAVGVAPATALLFGAIMAPTDPVLAADVQVGEPTVDEAAPTGGGEPEDEVRFSLTSEAGLNDGLAFPFVYASIALAASMGSTGSWDGAGWMLGWVVEDVIVRVGVGAAVGYGAGRLLARIIFDPPGRLVGLAESTQGRVALGAILLAYGVTETAHGYGFLAVFVAAVTLRHREPEHAYHRVMHQFIGEMEQLVTVALLVLLGAALTSGLLADLTVTSTLAGVALIVVVRPVAGWIALRGTRTTRAERRVIGFFGIRGIGSFYYLAFATQAGEFAGTDELWSAVTFTVLLSIIVHGATATPVMEYLDRRRARRRSMVG